MPEVLLDGAHLTIEGLAAIAHGAPVRLTEDAVQRMAESARWFAANEDQDVLSGKWCWLVGQEAPTDETARVRGFILGHCAGVGEPLTEPLTRALMAARAHVLARGESGARPEIAQHLVDMLNRRITPVIPSRGSVGAAGSPALAHMARVAFGLGGEAVVDGQVMPAAEALRDLPTVVLNSTEALSIINGSTLTTVMAAIAITRMAELLRTAEQAAALTFEVVRADLGCLDARALATRPHPEAQAVAQRMNALLEGSELVGWGRRADPFSIRCTPQVLGSAWDAWRHAAGLVQTELNGTVDNPVVIPNAGVFETGNFDASGIALAVEQLKVAAVNVASISERRIFRLTYGQLSGLPSFLAPDTGLHSGLMLAQYTAASLVSECKVLSHPAAVDSLPIVQHREDHVSMGPISARGALRILDALTEVLAIELMCAAQGLDFHLRGQAVDAEGDLVSVDQRRPGRGTRRCFDLVREHVDFWPEDRVLHPDLERLGAIVRSGRIADLPTE